MAERAYLPQEWHREHPPTVVVKMDIEGSEYQVLPRLFETGAICHVDALYIELHPRPGEPALAWYEATASQWEEDIVELCAGKRQGGVRIVAGVSGDENDDESFVDDGMPLPSC